MSLCLLLAAPRNAHAEPREDGAACSGPTVRADVELNSEWVVALREAKRHLAAQAGTDTCAEVAVNPHPRGVEVSVRLRDGRRATRVIESPGDLSNVLESLTLIPDPLPDPPSVDTTDSASADSTAAQPGAAKSTTARKSVSNLDEGRIEPPAAGRPTPAPQNVPTSVEVGLGPALALSLAPSYLGYGAGAHALVERNHWVLGTRFVWHIEDRGTGQALPSGFNMQQLQLGAAIGRRLELRPLLLDALLGATVNVINQEAFGADPEGIGGAYGDLSVSMSLRLATPVERGTRFFVGTTVDVFPGRLGRSERVDEGLPELPPAALTLEFGASWSVW
ncbi:MAG: hypothetical protein KC766_13525 [Myxococcales bacterium]|nr:hypothetical protein [Myxococcales bacterium]